jgi:TonB-dependent receptor
MEELYMEVLYTGKKLLFLFVLIIAVNIYGQGTIKGTITDSLSHDPLVGANVYLVGTALGSAVDIDGHYTISKIPFGKYTVRISYIGYKSKDFSVDVNSNKTISLNVRLAPAAIVGKEIVVSGQAEGQAAAINQQLSSNSIVNVVSQQKIQELPDANAAESIGRLPGVSLLRSGGEANKIVLRGLSPKFTTVTIDGVRIASTDQNDQGIDLSTISQGSLAGIELYKTLTSDQDADAIAGTVNLVTKKAPSKRLLSLDAKGDYNALDKSANQYNLEGRYGERFFNDVLGVQAVGNIEQTIRSSETTDYTYDFTGIASGKDYDITQFQPEYINELRKRYGASLLLDINTPDGGSIKFNTVYGKTSRNFLTSYRTYVFPSGNVAYDYEQQDEDIDIFNTSIHGDNNLFGFKTDWNFSFAQSIANTPYDYELNFSEASAADSKGNVIAGMKNVPQQYSKGPVTAWIPYAVNNFQAALLNQANDNTAKNLDKQKTAFLDLSKDYSLGTDLTGTFKFGGKYRENDRTNNETQSRSNYYLYPFPQYTKLANGSIVPKDLNGTVFQNLVITNARVSMINFLDSPPGSRNVFGQYALYPLINRTDLEIWRGLNINGYQDPQGKSPEYLVNDGNGGPGSDYNIAERISAAYAMNTLNIGRELTFIAGVRIESDNDDYSAFFTPYNLSGFPFPEGVLIDTIVNHSETTVLPNFQMIYRPFDFMNVRMAAYKALARPDFNYRLPQFVASSASGNSIYMGNPNLKNAVAWNYELETQFYGNDIGLFSISAFYKTIDNMFQYLNGAQISTQAQLDSLGITAKDPFPTNAQFSLYYPYNLSNTTKVWGFEVEHQADLLFLPGLLKNIVLDYNFSIVNSETYLPFDITVTKTVIRGGIPFPTASIVGIVKKERLEDQPQFFGNISLGYDIDGFSFRIAAFHQGKYNSSFSSDGRSDQEIAAYTRLDVAVKQKITDNISIFLDLNNITNASDESIYDDRVTGWEVPNTTSRYGMTGDFGLRLTL